MSSHRRFRTVRTSLRILGLGLLVASAAGAIGIAPSAADDQTYNVTAEAQSGLIQLRFPDAGLVVGSEVLNATPTRASTKLDSLGTSSAYAAAGYPGDIGTTVPSTAIGILSGFDGIKQLVPLLPPVPQYPLAASSDTANPVVKTESGAFTVSASTLDGASTAEALLGADQAGVTAVSAHSHAASTYIQKTSTARGDALAELNGLRIANLIDVSQRTTGRVSVAPGGKPAFNTDTLFGVTLLGTSGIKIGFGPQGLVAAGQSVLDKATTQTVLSSLKALGIGLDYVPETTSSDGLTVTSAGLRITETLTVPNQASSLNSLGLPLNANIGRMIVAVTLGQVTLHAEAGALPVPAFGASTAGSPTGSTDVGASLGSGGLGLGSNDVMVPGVSNPAVLPTQPGGPQQLTAAVQQPLLLSASGFYLVLAAAGLAAVGSSRLFGLLAVRLRFSR